MRARPGTSSAPGCRPPCRAGAARCRGLAGGRDARAASAGRAGPRPRCGCGTRHRSPSPRPDGLAVGSRVQFVDAHQQPVADDARGRQGRSEPQERVVGRGDEVVADPDDTAAAAAVTPWVVIDHQPDRSARSPGRSTRLAVQSRLSSAPPSAIGAARTTVVKETRRRGSPVAGMSYSFASGEPGGTDRPGPRRTGRGLCT